MELYLGIDGGGTRTVAWLVDGDGKSLGRGETGPSNPLKVGIPAAMREVTKAFQLSLKKAGIAWSRSKSSAPLLQAVCAGIAGTDRGSVRHPFLAGMRRHIPAHRHILTTDAAIALYTAFRDSPGILVISGTGSIAYGRTAEGEIMRVGGWGMLTFDDCGSGHEIGRKAVAAALQGFDGRGPQTMLIALLCRKLKLRRIDEVVGRQLDPHQIAAIFPLVIVAAKRGDRVARSICGAAGQDLAGLAVALMKKSGSLKRRGFVVAAGGVFKSSEVIYRAFVRDLRRCAPHVKTEKLEKPAVKGAVWLALNSGKKKT